jgi:tetratricopeptide (TPR) repeat protein
MARKQKIWLSAWGYYVVSLIPVIGLVQVGDQAMADRYTYLPSLGPFLLTGLLIALGVRKITILPGWSPAVKLLIVCASILAVSLLTVLTVKQIKVWENTISLWSYVIEKEPEFFLAYNNRGLAFSNKGDLHAAIADYDKSIALNPSYPLAYYNRGRDFQNRGQLDKALEDYNRAVALNTDYFEAYNNAGTVYYTMGRFAEAIESFKMALTLKPSYAAAHYNCGLAYVKRGLFPEAIDSFDRFIEMNPDFGEAYLSRGKVYLETGDKAHAHSDFQKACGLMNEGGCKALHDMESRL